MWKALLDHLPRGDVLDEKDWRFRHRVLEWVLAVHIPGLVVVGLFQRHPVQVAVAAALPVVPFLLLGHVLRRHRRLASIMITAGLVYASTALVALSHGAIEAHFHFFVIVGFIALYQDWVPFLVFILLMVISQGIGAEWRPDLIFSHPAGQAKPWLWSLIHGSAVVAACLGVTLFWGVTEEQQNEKKELARRLADSEIGRRQFTSDLLLNLARRNQGMVYRQLDIINELEESEQDPDTLAELFRLDHLATRVRRNAESLLVLSGEQPSRIWREPVPLRDVVRAAIAETEDLDRVVFAVYEQPAVTGRIVADLTHLLAELTENAVRFSPPDTAVTIRTRPDRLHEGAHLLTIEDWGVGMPTPELAAANRLLSDPPEVDLSVAQRLGFHVVARLAARHGIEVTLSATPGSGLTALVALPAELFESRHAAHALADPVPAAVPLRPRQPGARGAHAAATAPVRSMLRERLPGVLAGRVGAAARVPQPRPSPGAHHSLDGDGGGTGEPDSAWRDWLDSPPAPGSPGPGEDSAPPATGPTPPSSPRPAVTEPSTEPGSQLATPGGTAEAPEAPAGSDAAGAQATDAASGMPEGPGPAQARPGAGGSSQPLRRRVPQTHLAPELQAPATEPEAEPAPPPPAGTVAAALSRYQASRQAAQARVDADQGTSPPVEGSRS